MSNNTGFIPHQVEGIALLLWSLDVHAPERLATPFFHAAAAAAMDIPVELYFTAASVKLLAPGVAESLHAAKGSHKSILDYMREAYEHGAKFYACTDALHAQGMASTTLIKEVTGQGGAVQFMARAADAHWRALVF